MVAAPQSVSVPLTLPGEVRPRIESRLGFRVGGKLIARSVSVGDVVAPGQALARLDPTDLMPAVQA
jgi:multidrug efflux pump subunit AcrA (membrane-fusion protein)